MNSKDPVLNSRIRVMLDEMKSDKNHRSLVTDGGSPSGDIDQHIKRVELADVARLDVEGINYYWVNQPAKQDRKGASDSIEIIEGGIDGEWGTDPEELEVNDVLFYFREPELIGVATVTDHVEKNEDGGLYQIPINLIRFTKPIPKQILERHLVAEGVDLEQSPLSIAVDSRYLHPLTRGTVRHLTKKIGGIPEERGSDRLNQYARAIEVDIRLPERLYFDDREEVRRDISAAINSGKHIIFTGPPGTGKTKIARTICEQAEGHPAVDGYRFTTATSDMTAFDTIGGYMPSTDEQGEELEFQPRQFLRCFRNDDDQIRNKWLIIDEINRSDIDKAFGQLFSVLSGESVELPYERTQALRIEWVDQDTPRVTMSAIEDSRDRFPVTPAWRLLATMNSYDKASLYEMSYAFMRRFAFIPISTPDLENGNGHARSSLLNPNGNENFASAWLESEESTSLKRALEEVYQDIAVIWWALNEYRPIGPAIIKDMLEYVGRYDGMQENPEAAITRSIIAFVFPQLEGLRHEKQVGFFDTVLERKTIDEDGLTVQPRINEELLRRQGSDFLGADLMGDE